jgi:hypothetical protein
MAFKDYVYESDDAANSYLIRIDTDQATLSGAVVGTPTDGFHVRVSNTPRRFGITPRHINLRRAEGAQGEGKIHTTRVAICTLAAYNAISPGAGVAVNGINYAVASKSPERKR